ncbi:MAG: UbiD family decarboxylase [Salinigranum sp.]
MGTTEQSGVDSLRDFIDLIDGRGWLKRIDGADWEIEIGALTETVAFTKNPKALLFDSIAGYPEGHRVVTNLYSTEALQALALGLPSDRSGSDLVSAWREKREEMEDIPPEAVDDGPVRENVLRGEDVDVTTFPVPLWHEHDGGRYFGTGDTVITRTPDGEWVNTAVYRSQVQDEKTLGLMTNQTHHGRVQLRQFWERGEDAPIVMTAGQSPYVYAGSCLPLPAGYSELEFAGGLKGSPIEVIEHEGTGLPVPAHAEIAVIGHVPPPEEEMRMEGPFGECAGYYAGGRREHLVINVEEIWHRNDPILQGNPTMHGSAMRHALGGELVTSAAIWDAIDEDIPNVEGVYALYQQCQQGAEIVAVSIDQTYAGHAKQAAAAVRGARATGTMNRMIVVVDDDIDPSSREEVLFALSTRCDPAEDIDIMTGTPSANLDPRVHPDRMDEGDLTTSTMLVDACIPYHWRDEFPRRNLVSDDLREAMKSKWDVEQWT